MTCAMCGHGDTQPGTTTMTLTRGSTTLVVRNVPVDVCDNCGEEYISGVTHQTLARMLADAIAAHADVQISHYAAA